jgi:hypothetical protein
MLFLYSRENSLIGIFASVKPHPGFSLLSPHAFDLTVDNIHKRMPEVTLELSMFLSSFLEKQEFATPGTFENLSCSGRPCATCGKCRDWCYTGDAQTWNWIRSVDKWRGTPLKRWRDERLSECFQRRQNATCNDRLSHYNNSHGVDGENYYYVAAGGCWQYYRYSSYVEGSEHCVYGSVCVCYDNSNL